MVKTLCVLWNMLKGSVRSLERVWSKDEQEAKKLQSPSEISTLQDCSCMPIRPTDWPLDTSNPARLEIPVPMGYQHTPRHIRSESTANCVTLSSGPSPYSRNLGTSSYGQPFSQGFVQNHIGLRIRKGQLAAYHLHSISHWNM